jgi:hypothetical protein
MSRLPFGIVWDADLWAWLIGDLLRKPMYQLRLGHSTLILPCELRLRVILYGGKEGWKFGLRRSHSIQASTTIASSLS